MCSQSRPAAARPEYLIVALCLLLAAASPLPAQVMVYAQTSLAGSAGTTPGLFDQLGLLAGQSSQRKDFYEIFTNNTGQNVFIDRVTLYGNVGTASAAVLVPVLNGTINGVSDVLVPDTDPNHVLASVAVPAGSNAGTGPIGISFCPAVWMPAGGRLAFGFTVPSVSTVDATLFGTDTLANGLSSPDPPRYFTGFYASSFSQGLFLAIGNHYLVISGRATPSTDCLGPLTSNLAALPNPVAVNTSSLLTAAVSDSATGGSLIASAQYNINGGPFQPMAAADGWFDSVSENVTASLPPFTAGGLYTVCARGFDSPGNAGPVTCIPLPVYDPSDGFVTGAGNVSSPAGADLANPSVAGKATFGFVSRYLPGANTPSGSLVFQFHEGNLDFKSTSMEWLTVSGEPRAQFHGSGTVNGSVTCQFQVDAWDNSFQPGNLDAFGIRIYSCSDGHDRYGIAATAAAGSIIVHR